MPKSWFVDEYTKRETANAVFLNMDPLVTFVVSVEKLTEPLTDDQLAEQWATRPLPPDGITHPLPSIRSPATLVGVPGTLWSTAESWIEERLYIAVRAERAYYVWLVAAGDAAKPEHLSLLEFVVASITPLE